MLCLVKLGELDGDVVFRGERERSLLYEYHDPHILGLAAICLHPCWVSIPEADTFRDYWRTSNVKLAQNGEKTAPSAWAHLLHALGSSPLAEKLITRYRWQ